MSTCFVDSPFLRSLTPHFCVFLNRYIALFNKMQQKKRNRELTRQGIDASVVETQEVVAASLQGSHSKKLCVGGSILNLLGAEAIGRSHTRLVPKQMAIDAALSKRVVDGDLRARNNTNLTTAIVDLCHAENIPDRIVGTTRFKKVIDYARLVGPDYMLPSRKDVGGCFLDENAKAYKKGNFDEVTRDGPRFGYVMAGDGATIIKKPFF